MTHVLIACIVVVAAVANTAAATGIAAMGGQNPPPPPGIAAGPIVVTPLGAIRGNAVVHAATGVAVREFLGIPYAKPVSGEGRFRPARPVGPWAPATLDATAAGAVCPQPLPVWPRNMTPIALGEDCLSINVWARAGVGRPSSDLDPLVPVMFFIHGGGFVRGAGSLYNGTGIAR